MDYRFGYAQLNYVRKLGRGQGPAEEVALSFRTALGLQVCLLFSRFNALDNHELLEALSHVNDDAHDGRVIGIGSDLVDKGLLNFQDIDGKLPQIPSDRTILGAQSRREMSSNLLFLERSSNKRLRYLSDYRCTSVDASPWPYPVCFSSAIRQFPPRLHSPRRSRLPEPLFVTFVVSPCSLPSCLFALIYLAPCCGASQQKNSTPTPEHPLGTSFLSTRVTRPSKTLSVGSVPAIRLGIRRST